MRSGLTAKIEPVPNLRSECYALRIPRVMQDTQYRNAPIVGNVEEDVGCRGWPTANPSAQLWSRAPHQRLQCQSDGLALNGVDNPISSARILFGDK